MDSTPPHARITVVERLRQRLTQARALGFNVRHEMLVNRAGGWCEIAGTKTVFLDSALSAAEQLETLDQALAEYRPANR